MADKPIKASRDAGTGRFVTAKDASRRKKETVTETVKRKGK